MQNIIENNEKTVLHYVKLTNTLQTHYHFNPDFQNMDQNTGGKWLTHGTKHSKDNQLQSLEL